MNFRPQKQAAHLLRPATLVGSFRKPKRRNAFRAYNARKTPQGAHPLVLGTLGTLARAACPFPPCVQEPAR